MCPPSASDCTKACASRPGESGMRCRRPRTAPSAPQPASGGESRRCGALIQSVHEKIANRLGWMTSPPLMADAVPRLLEFAERVKRDGFTDVVLLGMGGSSLAPETLRGVLGVAPGWPRFHVLDSTDPAAVLAACTPPRTTLYLLASKSGTTIEPNSMAAYFRHRLEESGVPRWAGHFVAITDAGTELEARARAEGFRDLFVNPVRHRRALFRGVVFRPRAGGADGPARGGDHRVGAGDARRRRTGVRYGRRESRRCAGPGHGRRRARRPRQVDADRAARARAVRLVGGTAGGREHREERDRGRSDRGRAARRAGDVRNGPSVRAHPVARVVRRGDARHGGPRVEGVGRPGRRNRPRRAVGARRRIRALGNRDGGGRRADGDQPVRRAERAAGEGRDARHSAELHGDASIGGAGAGSDRCPERSR